MSIVKTILVFLSLLLVSSCATSVTKHDNYNYEECHIPSYEELSQNYQPDLTEIAKFPLGSFCNPIKARGPSGQREYLSRLICGSGRPPTEFYRGGSVGTGPYGGLLDGYIVNCKEGTNIDEFAVYMDLNHDYRELKPIIGFSIREDEI